MSDLGGIFSVPSRQLRETLDVFGLIGTLLEHATQKQRLSIIPIE